jgi:hypothetical protein
VVASSRRLAAVIAVVLAGACAADGSQPEQTPPTSPAGGPATAEPDPTQPAAPEPSTEQPQPAAPAEPAPEPVPSLDEVTDARQLALVLTAAERAVRDGSVGGSDLAEAAHTQQRAYRLLSRRPRWRQRVIRQVPQDLRPAVRRNIRASAQLAALVTPQPKLPDWEIVSPAPARRLLRHYRRAAAEYGIQWQYLAAINLVETRMGRIRGVSTAGAQGPMQFMPPTWDAYGEGDVHDDGDAIMAAARYLAAHGAPGDMRRALWHYNRSDYYVDAISDYAEVMKADERAFRGYYHWQVYYVTHDGDVHLAEGYGR